MDKNFNGHVGLLITAGKVLSSYDIVVYCMLANYHHRTASVMGDLGADAAEYHSLE
jgi:UDP-N-acetylmuramyl pentapeptide synthase